MNDARVDVCFQKLFWKSVADRGTFSRGSKSWGRGWLLLIKTWPSLGSPIGFQVCVFNVYVSRYPLYVRTCACLRLYARRNRGFVQVEGGTNSVSIVIRSMLLHITSKKIEEIGSFSFRIGLPRISILLDRPSKFEYNNRWVIDFQFV